MPRALAFEKLRISGLATQTISVSPDPYAAGPLSNIISENSRFGSLRETH